MRVALAHAWGPAKVLAVESGRRDKLIAAIEGLRDGMRGRTGPRGDPPAASREQTPDGDGRTRRALLLCAPFFGYYRDIARELAASGYTVDHHDDRPGANPLVKGLLKVRPALVQHVVDRYLDRLRVQTRGRNYDLIVVVNGKVLDGRFVDDLLEDNPTARSVLYLWDSIDLDPHVLGFADRFDQRFTFDGRDARDRPQFDSFLLFFTDSYRSIGAEDPPSPDYDLVNVYTAHPNRYALMIESCRSWRPWVCTSTRGCTSIRWHSPTVVLQLRSWPARTAAIFTSARCRPPHTSTSCVARGACST